MNSHFKRFAKCVRTENVRRILPVDIESFLSYLHSGLESSSRRLVPPHQQGIPYEPTALLRSKLTPSPGDFLSGRRNLLVIVIPSKETALHFL